MILVVRGSLTRHLSCLADNCLSGLGAGIGDPQGKLTGWQPPSNPVCTANFLPLGGLAGYTSTATGVTCSGSGLITAM